MQTMVPLYGFGGGGGTGAALTVTAPAGCTVTVSKDGKTKTKVAGTDGVAVFKGLATGQWTVTITDGTQTAQKTVTITADYTTEITLFAATIHVIYPAGATCTATDGVTTLTAPDTSGTWECVVPNAGTWTFTLGSGLASVVDVINSGDTFTVNRWYLFRNGSVVPWSIAPTHSNYASIDKKITIDGLDGRYPVAYATDKIDVTNYTKLKATVKYLDGVLGNTRGACIGVHPSVSQNMSGFEAYFISENKSETNFEANIANIRGNRYILVGCYDTKYEFTKVWLE